MLSEFFPDGEVFDAPFAATRFDSCELPGLLEFRDERHDSHPDERLLFVLDDQGQASYTSGHARVTKGLAQFDEAILGTEELAAYQQSYQLTATRQVEVVAKNLESAVAGVSFDRTWSPLIPVDDEDIDLLFANRNPAISFSNRPLCLHVPVTESSHAIIGAPNGYFGGDLTPAQNFVFAEHLRTEHGYELLGLGSYLIGFVRPDPASEQSVRTVLDDVSWLYSGWSDQIAQELAAEVAGSRVLMLSYRGA